jgi:hypothetical protein
MGTSVMWLLLNARTRTVEATVNFNVHHAKYRSIEQASEVAEHHNTRAKQRAIEYNRPEERRAREIAAANAARLDMLRESGLPLNWSDEEIDEFDCWMENGMEGRYDQE